MAEPVIGNQARQLLNLGSFFTKREEARKQFKLERFTEKLQAVSDMILIANHAIKHNASVDVIIQTLHDSAVKNNDVVALEIVNQILISILHDLNPPEKEKD